MSLRLAQDPRPSPTPHMAAKPMLLPRSQFHPSRSTAGAGSCSRSVSWLLLHLACALFAINLCCFTHCPGRMAARITDMDYLQLQTLHVCRAVGSTPTAQNPCRAPKSPAPSECLKMRACLRETCGCCVSEAFCIKLLTAIRSRALDQTLKKSSHRPKILNIQRMQRPAALASSLGAVAFAAAQRALLLHSRQARGDLHASEWATQKHPGAGRPATQPKRWPQPCCAPAQALLLLPLPGKPDSAQHLLLWHLA